MTTTMQPRSTKTRMASGLAGFAGVLLATVAVFQILDGIAALANDKVFVRGLNYTYEFDVTAWGWIHLIMGIIGLITGIGILMRQTWGRLVGIMIASLSCLTNFAFLPYYPLWAIVIIAFDALVIWALFVELKGDPEF